MKKSGPVAIKVALYGMDTRSYKTLELFLKGPCRAIAEVVSDTDAEIDIIDADFATAGDILENCRQQHPERPIVLLSLQTLRIANTHFVQKPVTVEQLTAVLTQTGTKKQLPEARAEVIDKPLTEPNQSAQPSVQSVNTAPLPKPVDKKRSAFEANEGGYTTFLGHLSDIDFSDPSQLLNASFEPKNYLLSYVLSAYKVAGHQGSAQQLNSMWKPLLIFPQIRKIWLDADDKQLRVFAGMEQNKLFAGNISLSPVSTDMSQLERAADKFQEMEAFIWKLSIWTSKGRFPVHIDPNTPVFLKHWPNFTRLMLIPDALRMAALLANGPRAPLDMVKLLHIRPQYVFAFVSACHSLGLLGQCQRQADIIVQPEPPKPNKKQNLFSKILHKLRGD